MGLMTPSKAKRARIMRSLFTGGRMPQEHALWCEACMHSAVASASARVVVGAGRYASPDALPCNGVLQETV